MSPSIEKVDIDSLDENRDWLRKPKSTAKAALAGFDESKVKRDEVGKFGTSGSKDKPGPKPSAGPPKADSPDKVVGGQKIGEEGAKRVKLANKLKRNSTKAIKEFADGKEGSKEKLISSLKSLEQNGLITRQENIAIGGLAFRAKATNNPKVMKIARRFATDSVNKTLEGESLKLERGEG